MEKYQEQLFDAGKNEGEVLGKAAITLYAIAAKNKYSILVKSPRNSHEVLAQEFISYIKTQKVITAIDIEQEAAKTVEKLYGNINTKNTETIVFLESVRLGAEFACFTYNEKKVRHLKKSEKILSRGNSSLKEVARLYAKSFSLSLNTSLSQNQMLTFFKSRSNIRV